MPPRLFIRIFLALVASLVVWGLSPALTAAQPTVPRPSLSLNATSFRPSETLHLTATVTPGPTPVRVDAYVAVELPDGSRLFLQGNGAERVALGDVLLREVLTKGVILSAANDLAPRRVASCVPGRPANSQK